MPIESPYKLVVAAKDGTVIRTVDLTKRQALTVGRSPRCDLTIDLDSISRRHATLLFLDGAWMMVDCDSKTKFRVDNQKVDRALLNEDRPIHLGGAYFWLQASPKTPAPPNLEEAKATEDLWQPDDSESGNACLRILDLECRPLHQFSPRGEQTSIGTSSRATHTVKIDGWAPHQLALIHERSGPVLMDISASCMLRSSGVSIRRCNASGRTLLRCGNFILEWTVELESHENETGLWDAIQNDSLG